MNVAWWQVKGIQRRHSEKDAAELSIFGLRIVLQLRVVLFHLIRPLRGHLPLKGEGMLPRALPKSLPLEGNVVNLYYSSSKSRQSCGVFSAMTALKSLDLPPASLRAFALS